MDPEERKAWQEDIDKYKGPNEHYHEGSFGRKMTDVTTRSPGGYLADRILTIFIDKPIEWFHDKVVMPLRRPPEAYYHKRYARVPTVDTCYLDDHACRYEATEQYKRDRLVDSEILEILKQRVQTCFHYHGGFNGEEGFRFCRDLQNDYTQAEINFKVKYGNNQIGAPTSTRAYFRQRVRMIREELYFMWLRDHPDKIPVPRDPYDYRP